MFDVCVDLRGRNAGVTEHFLEGTDFGAAGQHVRREAVSQCVRTDAFSAADSFGVFFDDAPHRDSRKLLSASVEQQPRFVTFANEL